MNLYVYYDVPIVVADDLANDVRQMQATVEGTGGIRGRLMKRPETSADRETWMEVYEGVDDDFAFHLDRAAAGIDWRGAGARHVERFVDV